MSEIFDPLMDEYIMYKKIGHPVQHDAQPDKKQVVVTLKRSEIHQCYGGYGENDKEIIVLLHNAFIAMVVVVPVQHPQKPVHHVFVDKPRCPFHGYKGDQCD